MIYGHGFHIIKQWQETNTHQHTTHFSLRIIFSHWWYSDISNPQTKRHSFFSLPHMFTETKLNFFTHDGFSRFWLWWKTHNGVFITIYIHVFTFTWKKKSLFFCNVTSVQLDRSLPTTLVREPDKLKKSVQCLICRLDFINRVKAMSIGTSCSSLLVRKSEEIHLIQKCLRT